MRADIDTTTVERLVAEAATAPSMHNAQPWLFRYDRGRALLELRGDPARSLPVTDPGNRSQHLGCGAALFNLRVAAARAGWEPRVRILPEPARPGLLARISFLPGAGPDEELAELHPALRRRRTSREPFSGEPVPGELKDGLSGAAIAEGARLLFLDEDQVGSVLELAEEAAYRESVDEEVRREVARWIAPLAPGGTAPAAEGIPAAALGPRSYDGRAPVRDFTPDRRPPGQSVAVFEHRPCLGLLGTRHDRPAAWLEAGQAMERVLLQATLDGLSTALSSQMLEWPELRWVVRGPFMAIGSPQMIIRLGYGPKPPGTPRRPLSEVLEIV
ncbi:Acg family FMN-binding oxidoreductase [Streptomyces sanyensis]|uniref:Nitroreductase n=1 Tax=Streptomyces sanyensis TaxID=568869 RepID=A0ABP9B1G6_9ACTN